jgi:signal peptidase II
MSTQRIFKILIILLLILSNVGCDQISKKYIRRHIDYNENIELLNNHVVLTKVENPGAFLSAGDKLPGPVRNILLSVLPLIGLALAILFMLTRQQISNGLLAGLCFIVGGGLGNIFDRMVYGSVTDFLHIQFGFFQTGIFNLADVSITTGVCILLFYRLFKK